MNALRVVGVLLLMSMGPPVTRAEPSAVGTPWCTPGGEPEPASVRSEAEGCCRVCRKGKACGDSCIARDKDCHEPPGCACDG